MAPGRAARGEESGGQTRASAFCQGGDNAGREMYVRAVSMVCGARSNWQVLCGKVRKVLDMRKYCALKRRYGG